MAPVADRDGYWGSPTSTLEWCEENYAVSYYIAEFWNTVSNLIFILPPIYGAIQTYKDGLEKRYLAAYLCLTACISCMYLKILPVCYYADDSFDLFSAVGLGSWCFHMTLKYEMQLLDELPMIYSCCVFVYCLYECFKYKNTVNYALLFLLITYSVVVSIVYLDLKEPVFHQIMYGTLVSIIVLRSVYIVLWVYPWLRGLGYTSLTVFLMGFFLWNVDNIFCDKLRALREKLPPVVGAVTQFHAWWHILTGLGSYLHILLSFSASFTSTSNSPSDVNLQVKRWLLLCENPGPLRSNNPKLLSWKKMLNLVDNLELTIQGPSHRAENLRASGVNGWGKLCHLPSVVLHTEAHPDSTDKRCQNSGAG
ncbi:hypothetical protein DUI87_16988 [Hirundo rustica rustica]|uniref:Alkaline ceramidase n=1 Tax=Hirundo rustica rustica TaxID=333673 RepID=A0A3M0K845_HIRRU|nr:hypothetical protein DUI87_16988 [Hirundo rustica rustica]